MSRDVCLEVNGCWLDDRGLVPAVIVIFINHGTLTAFYVRDTWASLARGEAARAWGWPQYLVVLPVKFYEWRVETVSYVLWYSIIIVTPRH